MVVAGRSAQELTQDSKPNRGANLDGVPTSAQLNRDDVGVGHASLAPVEDASFDGINAPREVAEEESMSRTNPRHGPDWEPGEIEGTLSDGTILDRDGAMHAAPPGRGGVPPPGGSPPWRHGGGPPRWPWLMGGSLAGILLVVLGAWAAGLLSPAAGPLSTIVIPSSSPTPTGVDFEREFLALGETRTIACPANLEARRCYGLFMPPDTGDPPSGLPLLPGLPPEEMCLMEEEEVCMEQLLVVLTGSTTTPPDAAVLVPFGCSGVGELGGSGESLQPWLCLGTNADLGLDLDGPTIASDCGNSHENDRDTFCLISLPGELSQYNMGTFQPVPCVGDKGAEDVCALIQVPQGGMWLPAGVAGWGGMTTQCTTEPCPFGMMVRFPPRRTGPTNPDRPSVYPDCTGNPLETFRPEWLGGQCMVIDFPSGYHTPEALRHQAAALLADCRMFDTSSPAGGARRLRCRRLGRWLVRGQRA